MNELFRVLSAGLLLATLGACVSDLTVGYSAIEQEDGGEPQADVDGGDALGRDGAVRDAQVGRDAQAGRDAGLDAGAQGADGGGGGSGDAARPDASGRDADASDASRSDAGDASAGDASADGGGVRDAGASDAGAMCMPADCTPAGLTTTSECPNGKPAECRRNDEGQCDLLCEDPSGTLKKPTPAP